MGVVRHSDSKTGGHRCCVELMQFTPTFLVTDFREQRGRYRSDPTEGKVMREFVGKAAFVTGGASGIGLALGRALRKWAAK